VGVVSHLGVVRSTPSDSSADPPHWRIEVVLLAGPSRCMATGRRCYPLALKLSNVLDPDARSVILDLASVAALVNSGMTILEAGLTAVEGEPPEPSR
jgi:hypothetical protein